MDASSSGQSPSALPDDPDQEILPVAQPQPEPATGTPVEYQALNQEWLGDTVTLTGDVVFHYRDYVLHADKVVYNRKTTELEADGHLQVAGGPNDILINASNGDMRLDIHTARFFNVHGSQGIRTMGRHTTVYSTPNPLLFSARVLIEESEGHYKLIDGSMTNCRIPHPDWQIIAHTIALDQQRASTSSGWFKFLGTPIFYLPYLRHAVAADDRESGLLIPALENSSLKGYVIGEEVYWAINRSMDTEVGLEYYSKRGWAPLGNFRYKGPGVDRASVRWNALIDRGIEEASPTGGEQLVNQGGVDILAEGIKAFSPDTRVAGTAEYLSSYVYRLVFNDNYSQATSSEVSSDVAFTHAHNGFVPSLAFDRFQTFASTTNGDEVRILHLPNLRYDVVTQPLGSSPLYWSMGSSLAYLNRSEPDFHARNVGRFDFYPRLTLPLKADGWNFVVQGALRDTAYSTSQIPSANHFIPTISHSPLNRVAAEASVDIRPPTLERDFELPFGHSVLRHVIEPELTYRYVGGIGPQARNVLLFDTTDIVTNTNQAGYSLTQRFYVRSRNAKPCAADSDSSPAASSPDSNTAADPLRDPDADSTPTAAPVNSTQCPAQSREWASWQLAQDFYIEPAFGGALVSGRRNVFESTLDLTGVAFLTAPRNISPLISRMRFNAVPNMRVEWDFDYDPKAGQMDADNLFAGYTFGRTTIGVVHALLNAVDENTSTTGTNFVLGTLKSQEVQPFFEFGKPSGKGANLAFNAGYDFAEHTLQYAGVEADYNWDCCGLTVGYRSYELGTAGTASPNYHEWLYSFTLANFANVGNIARSKSVFHDPLLPPVY
jgi:LPS-assembly protein